MAGLLATLCVLHVLGGAVHAGVMGPQLGGGVNLWTGTNGQQHGGCERCNLDKMVKNCPLDVEFVLDMSDSITPGNYERARNYVASQMQAVSDAFQDTHVGFLAFSDTIYGEQPLQARSDSELNQLKSRVQTLPQERYGTELADALRRANQNLFNHQASALVPGTQRGKVVVLVSDGCPDDDDAVKEEARRGRERGVVIVSVMASDQYVGLLKEISLRITELRTDIDWESIVACPSTYLPPVPRGSTCSDAVIAMDGSDSVRRWEEVMRNYLAYTALRYQHQSNAIGVVVFGTNVTTQSDTTTIQPMRNKMELAEEIETELSFPDERGTGTTEAINLSTTFLRNLGSPGTIVVITDGPALNPTSARQALVNAKSQNFKVVVIGVGSTVSESQLRTLAGPGSVVQQVDSYLGLYALDLSQYLCSSSPQCPGSTSTLCSQSQIFNFNTCMCVCRDRCPAGQNQNPNTCVCEQDRCANQPPCLSPLLQNPFTCQCECPRIQQCGAGTSFNRVTCQCESTCTETRNCGGNTQFDPVTCRCVCRNSCPAGQQLNVDTCVCGRDVCNLRCSSPFTLNPDLCQCVCGLNTRECPSGQILDTNSCTCVCRLNTRDCPSGQILDINSCRCVCGLNTRDCLSGQILDTASCACVDRCANRGPRVCNPPFARDSNCQCVCAQVPLCGVGSQFNPTSCLCEPTCRRTQPCGAGTYFDEVSCSCVPTCSQVCGFGQRLDTDTCRCVTTCNRVCGSGERLDTTTCRCVPTCSRVCGFGERLDIAACQCVPTCNRVCGSGQRLDTATCRCVPTCNRVCGSGQRLDTATCRCVPTCTRVCGARETLNTATCTCERTCIQSQQCPSGTFFDEDQCRCVPRCNNVCTANQRLNMATCVCEPICSLTCGQGQTLNIAACRCERTCVQSQQCASGTFFDEDQCRCVPRCNNVCTANQRLNMATCVCEPICSLTCGQGQRLNIAACRCESTGCTRVCGAGQTLNIATCLCERVTTPSTPESCQSSRCQNNQPAVKDCAGRCVCQCDISRYAGAFCDLPVIPSLCDNCTYDNGHYQAAVRGRCDMFVACQRLPDNSYIPHITYCPPGTIYKQNGRLGRNMCVLPSGGGTCLGDPCERLPAGAMYPHSQRCDSYWVCGANRQTQTSRCCPPNQGFNPLLGRCAPDQDCPNSCAEDPSFISCDSGRDFPGLPLCPLRMMQSDRRRYFNPLVQTQPFAPCAPTDFFNETACRCMPDPTASCQPYYDFDFDTAEYGFENVDLIESPNTVGYFNGVDSRIVLYRFSDSGFYMDYLEISLRVRPDNERGVEMAILSNGDCEGDETLAITIDGNNVNFKVQTELNSQVQTLSVPYNRNGDWISISFKYEAQAGVGGGGPRLYTLTGTVNGNSQSIELQGHINGTKCALQIGHGQLYTRFKGAVDDFLVWICKPNGSSNIIRSTNTNSGPNTNNGGNPYTPYNAGTNTNTYSTYG